LSKVLYIERPEMTPVPYLDLPRNRVLVRIRKARVDLNKAKGKIIMIIS